MGVAQLLRLVIYLFVFYRYREVVMILDWSLDPLFMFQYTLTPARPTVIRKPYETYVQTPVAGDVCL